MVHDDDTTICRAVVDLLGKPIMQLKGVNISLLVDVLRGSKAQANRDSGKEW